MSKVLGALVAHLSLVERLHRLLLDVIKDEFARTGVTEINPVQALLLFSLGEKEVVVGALRSLGYYQGLNVSYNLKKLVELGYLHHQRSDTDRRTVRVKLTEKGSLMQRTLQDFLEQHAQKLNEQTGSGVTEIEVMNAHLLQMERYWSRQIRHIY